MEKNNFQIFLKKFIKEVMEEEEIDEATVTGDIEGYDTPFAFTGNTSAKGKKKKNRRISTNSTGFKPVNEEIKIKEIIKKIIKK